MGSGKSDGTCHFLRVSTPAETASYGKWQVPWDLPLFNYRSGKSHGTCHFLIQEVASPVGLATLDFMKWQVPWDLPLLNSRSGKSRDLPLLNSRNGKSHGTCHFRSYEVASPLGLVTFEFKKWQVPRDLPL